MKKLCLLLTCFLFLQTASYAAKMQVAALNNFTTQTPDSQVRLFVLEDFYLNNSFLIPKDSVLVGEISEVKEPKRLKQNAKFKVLILYFMDSQQNKYKFNLPIEAKYGKPLKIDKKNLAESGALFVAGQFIPGASYIYHGVQGAKNSKNGRIKGAVSNIYEHSFLTMARKGNHLNIKKYDCFNMIFPKYKEDKYNYQTLLTPIDNYGNILKNRKIDGSKLQINYPHKHQKKHKIKYTSRLKQDKSEKEINQ